MTHSYDRGIPKAFIKGILKKVSETGNLNQLYELFIKYKTYMLDDSVAASFMNRIEFFEDGLTSSYDMEKAQEFKSDIDLERQVVQVSNPKVTKSTITLSFDSISGSLYKDCIRELVKLAIDRFKGQKASMCVFLGINENEFLAFIKNDTALKAHWEFVKRKNKKQLGV